MLSGPDGFMLYGIFWVEFFSTSELPYPNMKNTLQLFRAGTKVYMISVNPNVSHGSVDCSFYTRRFALKGDSYKKRMDMFGYTSVEFNLLETLAEIPIKPTRQELFIQKIFFNNAPVRRIAIAMNTNSAYTRSYTETPFWYQKIDLRQIRILGGGQPHVHFDAAGNCCLYVTTRIAMNFQDDLTAYPMNHFKDHDVLP